MSQVKDTFMGAGVSLLLMLEPGQSADYAVTGTFTGQINLEQSTMPDIDFETQVTGAANADYSGTVRKDGSHRRWFRFRAVSLTAGAAVAEIWSSGREGVQEVVDGTDRIELVRGAIVIMATSAAALLATVIHHETKYSRREVMVDFRGDTTWMAGRSADSNGNNDSASCAAGSPQSSFAEL